MSPHLQTSKPHQTNHRLHPDESPNANPNTNQQQTKTQHDQQEQIAYKAPYFSKWSRTQFQNAMANGQVISIYVEKISVSWSPLDLYRIMSKYGEVMDVYIPRKMNRQGKKFCFVRFRVVADAQRLLSNIQRMHVEKDTVKVQANNEMAKGVTFIPTSDTMRWLSCCLIGTLKDPNKMISAPYVWKLHGFDDVKVSILGGDTVLICFPSKERLAQFEQESPDWVGLWFKSLKPWQKEDRVMNRRCWLFIRGVPLHAWCQEFFSLIASVFGSLIRVHPYTEQRQRLDGAILEVLTSQGGRIEKEIEVIVTGTKYVLQVVEEVCMECTGADMVDIESDCSEPDSPGASMDGGDGHGDGGGTAAEEADPFNLMPIITGSGLRDSRSAIKARSEPIRKIFESEPELPLIRTKPHELCNQGKSQALLSDCASCSNSNSKPLLVSNFFGPLANYDEGLLVRSDDALSPQPSLGHKTAEAHTPTVMSPMVSMSRSWSGTGEYSERCNSSESRYIKFLEGRLAKAVRSGRVNKGRRFRKIKDTGSLTSTDSSSNNNIRRSHAVDETWCRSLWSPVNLGFRAVEPDGLAGGLVFMWDMDDFKCSSWITGGRWLIVEGTMLKANKVY
ncbi:hypothetical protein Tsubulata_006837 [Turnera subulata]|uniref:RRM domain-containing protein n=1 Tax=Turnera subulata TaxID=218843 RepID=A0A9Q0J4M7_9ROSI|nr:hypothetical protein Tsubulata_006837 [Turnera subulata]